MTDEKCFEEMMEILGNIPVAFGLTAQGHIPTVEKMLADGKNWDEIGQKIGWLGGTAKKHYGWYCENKQKNTLDKTKE